MKKRTLIGIAALFVAAGLIAANAATQSTGKVLTDNVALDKDLTVYQDYSEYPGTVGDVGKIVRFYDFDVQGGAVGTIKLMPAVQLKDNMLIRDGYIKVMTAVLPLTSTKSISANSAADMYAAVTNTLGTADALVATVPVGTVATSVQLTDDRYVTMTIATAAITNGKYMVVLDVEMAP
jgi:hypothetical protein